MSSGLLVPEAVQALRQWLAASQLRAGARLPSERALAKDLGIRHYAVNRAMAMLVAEREVERRGQKLFYSPQSVAAQSFTCDLVAPARSVYLAGYSKAARELGVTLRVHAWQSLEHGISALLALDRPETESVIYEPSFSAPAARWEPAVDRLVAHAVPVVVVSQPSRTAAAVMGDYTRAVHLALQHFKSLSHNNIALIAPVGQSTEALELAAAWGPACRQLGLEMSAGNVFLRDTARMLHEDVRELVDDLIGPRIPLPAQLAGATGATTLAAASREITAIAIYSESESSIPSIIREFAERRRMVPRNISLVSLRDSTALRNALPPITATTLDMAALQEMAFRMAQRSARRKEEPKSASAGTPPQVRLQPQLVVRASTASLLVVGGTTSAQSNVHAASGALAAGAAPHTPIPMRDLLEKDPFALTPRKTAEELELALRQAYPLTRWAEESRFSQVDLSTYTNRPLNFRRGWLGDLPLRQLTAGRHMIHGVPFQVLGGTSRAEGGAIVFHSAVNSTGHARELPGTLSIPVEQDDVQAIYVLHGCGYAKYNKQFATYRFMRGRKEIEAVPLVSYGQPPPVGEGGGGTGAGAAAVATESASTAPAPAPAPNIQDWWPDFPHMDFPHARMAPIMESRAEDSAFQHVYIYTLEWINPQPGTRVTSLEVTVDPAQSTTLGMLAVTVLRKQPMN